MAGRAASVLSLRKRILNILSEQQNYLIEFKAKAVAASRARHHSNMSLRVIERGISGLHKQRLRNFVVSPAMTGSSEALINARSCCISNGTRTFARIASISSWTEKVLAAPTL
jgi:hypothetical protein